MSTHALEGGFAQPPIDAAQGFRAVMNAMARPGTLHRVAGAVPPAPLSIAAGVCVLTLCDHETPVYLAPSHDLPAVREWIAFHTGASIAPAETCQFAIGEWPSLLPLQRFSVGSAEYPDRSATLMVELPEFQQDGAVLRGPGIKDTVKFSVPSVSELQLNHRLYPLGLDFIFTTEAHLVAIPRSTEVQSCTSQ